MEKIIGVGEVAVMAKYQIVVTDHEYENLNIEEEIIGQLDAELVAAQCRTEEEVIRAAQNADAILNQYAPVTRKVIQNLKKCKVISRYGVGVNTIDLQAATEKGIVAANCTDYCLDEVADHALALLLAAARKVALLNEYVKNNVWDYKKAVPIFRLRGRVLGLVGFGKIPQNLCVKAKAFGLRIVAFDPFVSRELALKHGIEPVDLDTLCRTSDFISVHAPLSKDTQALIGERQFNLMKPEAVIINTSRGPVIDEQALINALQHSKIAGAALDVLEREPIAPDNPLLRMEQVILNPHVAWYSEESEQEMRRKVARNIVDVLTGYYPAYLANPEVKSVIDLKERFTQ